jgi:hypothetical protein
MTQNLFDYVEDLSQNMELEIITCLKKKKDENQKFKINKT